MTIVRRALITVLLASIALIAIGWGLTRVAFAQAISADQLEATYRFAESLTFTATFKSEAPVVEATLFYQAGGAAPISVPARPFDPAPQVVVTAQAELGANAPRAFTAIRYWWEVTDRAGNHLRTATQSLPYIDNRFAWRELIEGSVRLHWYEGDSGLAALAASIANQTLPRLQQQLSVAPPSPIDIYVYGSLADLRSAVELMGRPWLGGQARPELGVVMLNAPPGDTAAIQLRRDVPHELTHLMVYVATAPRYDNVPAWLDEGLATINEGEPNPAQAVALENALAAGQVPSLESLCGAFPTDSSAALAAYAQSRGVVQEIIDGYGTEGISALLEAYRDGATCEGGVERGLSATLTGLDLRWRASLQADGGASSVARGSGPWALIALIVLLPLAAVLVLARRPGRPDMDARA